MMMEFRDLVRLFRNAAPFLFSVVVIGILGGAALAGFFGNEPNATVLVSLRLTDAQTGNTGRIQDGYYVVETERRFGGLLGEMLRSAVSGDLQAQANVAISRVVPVTPFDYQVSIRGSGVYSPDVSMTVERSIAERMKALSDQSGESLRVSASVGTVVPGTPFSRELGGTIGGMFALIFGIGAVALRRYFSS